MKSSLARFGAAAFLVAMGLAPLAPEVIRADTAGYTVTPTAGSTVVAESGGTDTLTVVLNSLPTGSVVLTLSSSDTGEATVSPSSLTFTTSNWSVPQTVTVTGIADNIVDGNQAATITLIVDPGVSANEYDTLPNQTVSVSILDIDGAGVSAIGTDGSNKVTEAGGTDTFNVVLNKLPTANVVISVVSRDTGEVTVSPASLTFTTGNWNVPQSVTLTGVDDAEDDGDQTTLIDVTVVDAQSAAEYGPVFNQALTVITIDNDGIVDDGTDGGDQDDGDQGDEDAGDKKGGQRPGWGCGDRNHEHTGPAGRGGDKPSPCKEAGDEGDDAGLVGPGASATEEEDRRPGQGKAKGHDKKDDNPGKGNRPDDPGKGKGKGR